MKTWRTRLAWLALAVVAGLTSWLVIANHASSEKPARRVAAPLADYSMRDAVITRYAASGNHHYVLHSELVTHERRSDTSRLKGVELDYYPRSSPYWHLSARHGKLSQGGNHITLVKHVRARQPGITPSLHLATSKLIVLLATHRIRSQARVSLRQGARETRGVGLNADLDTGKVQLLNDVKSRYVQ